MMIDRDKYLEETLKLIEKYNVTAYEIEQNTDFSAVGIQKIINRETKKPQLRTLETITSYINKKYNNISEEIGYSKQKQLKSVAGKKQLYYPDIVVTNSDIELYDKLTSGDVEVIEMYDPNLEGADVVLPNFNNSNAPYIQSGDLVGYRKLTVKSFESLNLDLLYMIITVNNQRMNKKLQVYKDDDKKLWCISINKDEHKPFPILKEDIIEVWEVVGVSRRFI